MSQSLIGHERGMDAIKPLINDFQVGIDKNRSFLAMAGLDLQQMCKLVCEFIRSPYVILICEESIVRAFCMRDPHQLCKISDNSQASMSVGHKMDTLITSCEVS